MELSTLLPKKLLPWYDREKRSMPWRSDPTPYHVWVSEIMLQQTRVEAVREYYSRFMKALPDVYALANADEETLLKLWEGLGYYRRVYNLQKAAQIIVHEFQGEIPKEYHLLRALPGIGDYTAGAISSIAFQKPKAAVDGNVLRVIMRLLGDYRDISSQSLKKEVSKALEAIYPKNRCGDFTQSLMELGAMVCLPNGAPKCEVCPLSAHCIAHLQQITDELPVKPEKKKRKIQKLDVLILRYQDKIALEKRTEAGLLHGLWQLPNLSADNTTDHISNYLKTQEINYTSIAPVGKAKHIFTHIEWQMTAYVVTCTNQNQSFCWVTANEQKENYSLPSAFQHFSKYWINLV